MGKLIKKFRDIFLIIYETAKKIKKDIKVLYCAYKHHNVPFYAKIVLIIVVAYALSPIDLIPDFIPVLGYLDDLILLPLGISLAIKLIPKDIISQCRNQAENIFINGKPKNWIAGGLIILFWILLTFYLLVKLFY